MALRVSVAVINQKQETRNKKRETRNKKQIKNKLILTT